jgi:hypothetical protein
MEVRLKFLREQGVPDDISGAGFDVFGIDQSFCRQREPAREWLVERINGKAMAQLEKM